MYDISKGLGAVKTGFDLANIIKQRVKENKLSPNEILDLVSNLQQSLLDSQFALNEAGTEIRRLEAEISEYDKQDKIEADLDYVNDGGFYIRKSENQAGKDVKYCPTCWGATATLVPLYPHTSPGIYDCHIHKVSFETQEYRRRQQQSWDKFHRGY